MKAVLFALSAAMALSSATGAIAAPACSGDFKSVDGQWIADPRCEHNVAEGIAAGEHSRIARHPMGSHEISREQFCLGNENINADAYCAPYKD